MAGQNMSETSQRRIVAADLVGLRRPSSPTISPDGKRVAFVLSETDFGRSEERRQVHTVGPEQQLTYAMGDARSPRWSPDGKWLAFVSFRPQPHEDEEDDAREDGADKDQVFVLPAAGGEAKRLSECGEGVDLYRWMPDGSGVLTLGQSSRSPAESGWRRRRRENQDDGIVVSSDIPSFEIWFHPLEGEPRRLMAGERGLDDFDISPDGLTLAYATTHTGRPEDDERSEIVLRDIESGQERPASQRKGGCETGPRISADGKYLFFAAWADETLLFSRQELFVVELENPSAKARPLLEGVDRDLEEYICLPDGRVAALVAWGMESRLLLIEPGSGRWERVPLEGKVLGSMDVARNTGELVLIVEDAARCPELALLKPPSGELELLSELNPQAENWIRARRRQVTWENEGFVHEGLLLLPNGETASPPPVLTWIHGGPHWRVLNTLRVYEAEALAASGWAVFLPQYRGSSGQAEAYTLAIREDLGGADARDILSGLQHLGREGLVDLERAAVAGASYGGYLTNWLLATSDRFKAGVSIAGIFDLAQDYSSSEYSSWEEHYLGGRPWDKPELYHERSPLTHAASIEAPMLILQGLEDDNTVFTNSKGLYRALIAMKKTVELVLYPREGHGLSEPAHRLDAITRMVDWLGRHVLGETGTHLDGRVIDDGVVRLVPLGHQVKREISGVRPIEGRVFLEVSVLIEAKEGGLEFLRLVPCGPSSDLVLVDPAGDVHRPMGLPLDVHGQQVLFSGRGALEAWMGEEGEPPSLPATVVFEVPQEWQVYQLRVSDLPPVLLDVRPDPEP